MKTLNETFTDEEYKLLFNEKEEISIIEGDINWHDFILKKCLKGWHKRKK